MTMPAEPQTDEMLRFAIVDEDDLSVMSAHLQDAHLFMRDAALLPSTHRFALVVSRIDWQALAAGRQLRRQTGLHFERVLRVQRSGFDQAGPDAQFQLLAIAFRPTAAPAGEVLLTFAGGRLIKLDVECLEAEMRDLTACWPVSDCPQHRLDEVATAR